MIEDGSYKLKGDEGQHVYLANDNIRKIISKAFDINENIDKYFQIDTIDENIQVCMIDLKSKSPIKCKKVKIDERSSS